jgi:lactate dehydrogenase-like 2-hydroxyacid dehydrogenase
VIVTNLDGWLRFTLGVAVCCESGRILARETNHDGGRRQGLSKPILVLTDRFTKDVEERIERDFTVRRLAPSEAMQRDALLRAAEGADAMFINPPLKLDAEFFRGVPGSVKVIATFSVGYDHIDLRAAAERGIPIANTPGVLTDATADLTMLLLLGASRRAYEGQQRVRTGAWAKGPSDARLGTQPTGKVLGIYGMGRIGQAVARRARAFGMKIHYSNRQALALELAGDAVFHKSPLDLLRASEFLSLHAPHTPETHHFLNAETIALLPAGAIVINAARGGLVEDEALIAALRSGRVAAAGLDVYEGEPNIHPAYVGLMNTFLLPHVGSATLETNTAMGMLALDNIDAVLGGRAAPTLLKV